MSRVEEEKKIRVEEEKKIRVEEEKKIRVEEEKKMQGYSCVHVLSIAVPDYYTITYIYILCRRYQPASLPSQYTTHHLTSSSGCTLSCSF